MPCREGKKPGTYDKIDHKTLGMLVTHVHICVLSHVRIKRHCEKIGTQALLEGWKSMETHAEPCVAHTA